MAKIEDLPLKYRMFMRSYAFRRYVIADAPRASLARPLEQARVALVTTAGFHEPGDAGFDLGRSGGDPSFRVISVDVGTQTLVECHKSDAFDPEGIRADRNVAFPLDRFRELEAAGMIGGLAPRHVSFMGSITRPEPLIAETAPRAARLLVEDGVDVAFLTPV